MSKFLHSRIHHRQHDNPLTSVTAEMCSTHLLGHAGQFSQTYVTHLAAILTPRNQPPTVNRQWPPSRVSRMSHHTRFNISRKTETAMMHGLFLGTNTVYRSIRPSISLILYFYYVENFKIRSYLKCDSKICHQEAHAALVKPGRACAKPFLFPVKPHSGLVDFDTESIVCCLTQHVIGQFHCIIIKI